MSSFFDINFCDTLRNLVNSTNIFYRDTEEKNNWNLICAVMDRIDDSSAYLCKNNNFPKETDDFLLFLLHASIIKDAVKEITNKLGLNYDSLITDKKQHFHKICTQEALSFPENKIPEDDKFFEYIRSLAFAHPLQTNRANFLEPHETQYSPFIITDNIIVTSPNNIGIRVYSTNSKKDAFTIFIPFDSLKDYIYDRYKILNLVIIELNKRISNKQELWQQRKVNRSLSNSEILDDIKHILTERYMDTYDIDTFLKLLDYEYTIAANNESIRKIQEVVTKKIPDICNYIDSINQEGLGEIFDEILYKYPEKMPEGTHYQLEKIFNYLDKSRYYGDQMFGLTMAKHFSDGFAKKWVIIDVDKMDFEEIKLLTTIACYLESEEQKGLNNDKV